MLTEESVSAEIVELADGWSAEIHRDWGFPDEVIRWWQAASERQGDVGIFVSPGWLEQWWSGWGSPGALFTVVLRDGGSIRGIFPYYVAWEESRKIIRSLAVEVYHEELADQDAIEAFVRLLEVHFREYHVEMEYLSEAGAALFVRTWKQHRFPVWVYTEPFAPYLDFAPYMQAGKSWDEFVEAISPHFASKLRKKLRQAEREAKVTLDVHQSVDGLQELLDDAFDIEARGWKGKQGTAIRQVPRQEKFVRLACEWAARNGKLWLVVLRMDGKMSAFDLGIENAGTVFVLKTSFDEEVAGKYSPGHLMQLQLLKLGYEGRGFHKVNFLGKNDAWKEHWTKGTGTCQWLFVYPHTLSGRWEYLRTHGWKETLKRSPAVVRLFESVQALPLWKRLFPRTDPWGKSR